MNENFLAGKLNSTGKGDKNSVCHRTEKRAIVDRYIHTHTFLAEFTKSLKSLMVFTLKKMLKYSCHNDTSMTRRQLTEIRTNLPRINTFGRQSITATMPRQPAFMTDHYD